MRAGEESFERLRAALDELAAADAAELVAEARAEARARVRSMLSDALAHSMLEHARGALRHGISAAPAGAPSEPRGTRTRPGTESEPRGTPRPHSEGDAQPDARASARYVYGVIDSTTASLPTDLAGIGDTQVKAVSGGDLAAVSSLVPEAEFDESELKAHLSDMAWVETVAREHEHVLDEVGKLTTVIPMRMCTVYRTEDGVREMLDREGAALRDALEHLRGKREWGVQAFFSRARARPSKDGQTEAAGGPSTGVAYMQRRREEQELEAQLAQLVDQAGEEIHEHLQTITVEAAVNPPHRPEVDGRPDEMVLNGVYLVEDSALERFRDAVRNLQARFSATGLELVITGPWPPYHFLPGSIGAAW